MPPTASPWNSMAKCSGGVMDGAGASEGWAGAGGVGVGEGVAHVAGNGGAVGVAEQRVEVVGSPGTQDAGGGGDHGRDSGVTDVTVPILREAAALVRRRAGVLLLRRMVVARSASE